MFSRFTGKRQPQVQEIQHGSTANERFGGSNSDSTSSSPLEVPSEGDRVKLLNGHRRESSILSLPSSVTDLGHTVRRSVSLRSHRTQHSTGSLQVGPGAKHHRYPSSGNVLTKSPPLASSVEGNELALNEDGKDNEKAEQSIPQPQPPPKSRGKLSISARSFSQRFKSTDTLPLVQPEQRDDTGEKPPPLPSAPAPAVEPPHPPFSMLVTPSVPKRPPPDRPALAPQASFSRDISTSHGGLSNGSSLQPIPPSSAVSSGAGNQNPNAVYQSIHEISAKRMATIDYLRKVHEGNIFYFGTLHYTSQQLHTHIPSLHTYKQGRRATSYLALGYSLPMLLELNSSSPTEYLRALTALLHEFETYQSLSDLSSSGSSLSRARVGAMFKSGISGLGNRSSAMRSGRRASAATDSIAIDPSKANLLGPPSQSGGDGGVSPQDTSPIIGGNHDFQHLLTPHLPFEPDFNTTFSTLCDTLIDTYANLLNLVSGPEVCTVAVGEAFAKADKSVRKILVANVMREFEDGTRAGVKGEVAGVGRLVLGGLM